MELPGDKPGEFFNYEPDPVTEYDLYLDKMRISHPVIRMNSEVLYEMVADESEIPVARALIERLTRPNMN